MPYPDLDYVRRFVPIFDIATQLDLRIVGSVAHCWRPDNHQHGDRTPSVGLFKRRNRAKCFVCDPKPLSPIDLVMSVLRLDFREALRWLTSRWEIPKAAKGKHIEHQQRWPERFRVVNGSTLGSLIRSGIWASFTPAQCKILPVLEEFADAQTRKVTISYRGIMRYSEVRSPSTVAAALRRFRSLRILSVETSRNDDGFRSCNSYRLTLDDPAFLTLANETYKKQKEAIAQERGLRAEARRQRQRTITGNSLSNGCSAGAFDATATRNVK